MLVTVAVTTYKSALYIAETLDSIFNQAYAEIALVVSDDCSPDNTLEVINAWVSKEGNSKRFHSVEVISVPKNTGVSANCNRCIAASKSDWIKFIAGDDILLPNCIADNIAFATENPQAQIVFSRAKMYQDTFEEKNYIKTVPLHFPDNLMHPNLTAADQYQLMLVHDRITYTPTYFFNKNALQRVGNYDEKSGFIEDYPMWLKLTKSGERLYYFHKETVGYRIHANANNNKGGDVLFRPSVIKDYPLRKALTHPNLPWEIAKSEQFVYLLSLLFRNMNWNKNTKLFSSLYRFGSFYANPFFYIYAIKKRLPGNKNNLFYS